MYEVEHTWILGCEWVVAESFQDQNYSAFRRAMHECYEPISGHGWAEDTLLESDGIKVGFIANQMHEMQKHPEKIPYAVTHYYSKHEVGKPYHSCEVAYGTKELPKDIARQLIYAIHNDCDFQKIIDLYNPDEIQSIDNSNKDLVLSQAFTHQSLNIAGMLIDKFDFRFNHREFVQTTPIHPVEDYVEWVVSTHTLRPLSEELQSVARTVYTLHEQYKDGTHRALCDIFTRHIYSDDLGFIPEEKARCKEYTKHQPTKDVVTHIVQYLLKTHGLLKIYVPSGNIVDSFFAPPHLLRPLQFPHVFVSAPPMSRSSHLIHELGHFVLYELFHNQNKPFTRLDVKVNSERYQTFKSTKHEFVSTFYEKILGKDAVGRDPDALLRRIGSQEKVRIAVGYFHANYGDKRAALVFFNSGLKYLKIAAAATFEEKNNSARKYLQNLWAHDYEEMVYFIFRVYEWSIRPAGRLDSELLNRMPEIYSRNPKSDLVKLCLEPLARFWKKYITTVIEKEYTEFVSLQARIHKNEAEYSISKALLIPIMVISATIVTCIAAIRCCFRGRMQHGNTQLHLE